MTRLLTFEKIIKETLVKYKRLTGKYPSSLDELEKYLGPKVEKAWFNEIARRPMKNTREFSPGDYCYFLKPSTAESRPYEFEVYLPGNGKTFGGRGLRFLNSKNSSPPCKARASQGLAMGALIYI